MTSDAAHPAHHEGRLTLTTLGGWSVSWTAPDGSCAVVTGPSKPAALLVYLAVSPGWSARREHLLDLLWADLEPDAGRHALRQTLWQIRRRAGADLVVADGDRLTVHPRPATDRDAFLAAVEAQENERAVALYTGDFLPGFAAPGGAEFERWADLERDRLRNTFLRVAEAVVHERLDAGRAREGIALARRVRDTARSSESGWRLLLEALGAAGDTLGAAVEADALARLLAEERREPEPATRAAIRVARGAPPNGSANGHDGNGRPGPAGALVAELVGREREFSDILRAWTAARGGSPRHVHLTAPAGLGKTRLLCDVHARLRSSGGRSVLLRANPGERLVGFAVAGEIAAALAALPGSGAVSPAGADTLVALHPSLSARYPAARADGAAGEEALRRRAIALTELVCAVADEAPLALLLDDVHWADPASRQLLGALLARLDGERVLVVTTSRPAARVLPGRDIAERIVLEPLSPLHVAALVTSLGRLPDEPWAADLPARLHAATRGSPLLVLETLQLALEHRWLALAAGAWSCLAPEALAAACSAGSALTTRIGLLDRDQRWLLLILAVVGSPLSEAQLRRALPREPEALGADLALLEQRGFATRSGEAWSVGHDEIAGVVLASATPEAVRAAHLAVGRAAAAEPGKDAAALLRAGQHLARAGNRDEVARVFHRWFVRQRGRGDTRPALALAAEFLGPPATDPDAKDLVTGLPRTVRWGFHTPARKMVAAAAVLAAAVLGGRALATRQTAPETELFVMGPAREGPGFQARRIRIRADRWIGGRKLDAMKEGTPYPAVRAAADWGSSAAYSATRDLWVVSRTTSGSDAKDLFLVHADGREERLTTSPGDDVRPNWAPDGTRFAFCSDRWGAGSVSHVAVMDLASRGVRQLTDGPDGECEPRWSLDGTRIAYLPVRYGAPPGTLPRHLCWTAVDGADGRCIELQPGYALISVSRWLGPSLIGAIVQTGGHRWLASVDVANGAVTPIREGISAGAVSPDGRWALGVTEAADEGEGSWLVFPILRPDQAIALRFGAGAPEFVARWGRSTAPPSYLDRVLVTQRADSIPLEAPYQLRARGIATSGDTIRLPVARWWSGDTSVATVTADGLLRGVRRGQVWIHVTAGGWRTDSVRIGLRSSATAELLREDWRGPLDTARWTAFGEPAPALAWGPGGVRALWSGGDASFTSGVHSRDAWGTLDGLGVEALVSPPAAATPGQRLSLSLDAGLDVAALAVWDRRTGALPRRREAGAVAACTADVPAPGGGHGGRLVLSVADVLDRIDLRTEIKPGRWYRLRVQIFPDGRCGAAVDGRPVWRSRHPLSLESPFRLVLDGASVDRGALFGPVEVWQGVKGDVDWTALDRRPATAGAGAGRPPAAP